MDLLDDKELNFGDSNLINHIWMSEKKKQSIIENKGMKMIILLDALYFKDLGYYPFKVKKLEKELNKYCDVYQNEDFSFKECLYDSYDNENIKLNKI
jgi:hypothetical protein